MKKNVSYEQDLVLLNTQWKLSSWSKNKEEIELNTKDTIEILFDINLMRIQGNDGCNQFQGDYKIILDTLKVSNLGSTKMYCGDESSKSEKDFIAFISNCTINTVSDKELVLLNNENSLLFNPK